MDVSRPPGWRRVQEGQGDLGGSESQNRRKVEATGHCLEGSKEGNEVFT